MDLSNPVSRYQFGPTRWSVVFPAGKEDGETARNQLLIHYHDAVYRYLCARIGDSDAAGELFSRFAERVLELHPFLQRADPKKGRFRDYLKTVLQHMVIDYHREVQRKKKKEGEIKPEAEPAQPAEDPNAEDAEFQKVWAQELLNQAWKALEQHDRSHGTPYHAMLLYKAQNPAARSQDVARHFSGKLARPISAENARKLQQRGQELLSDFLVEEVARSLAKSAGDTVNADQVAEELINLQLLDASRRKAVERYRGKRGEPLP